MFVVRPVAIHGYGIKASSFGSALEARAIVWCHSAID